MPAESDGLQLARSLFFVCKESPDEAKLPCLNLQPSSATITDYGTFALVDAQPFHWQQDKTRFTEFSTQNQYTKPDPTP
jgi:hypothetical protein